MKNGKPLDLSFPTDLVDPLEEYLDRERPLLMSGRYTGDALWVSYRSRVQHEASFREGLCRWTAEAFGLPIGPHLFRDCAVTSLAVYSPEEVQIGHLVLGNDYATMEKHYNAARALDATRHYNDELDRLRQRRHPAAHRRPRR